MLLVEKRQTDERVAGLYDKEDCSMQLKGTATFSFGQLFSLRAAHLIALLSVAFCFTSRAQPRIVLSDLFTKTNLYWRAYANRYDPSDSSGSTAFSVPAGLIGTAGTNNFWDFSKGPTNEVLRFDYISPVGLAEAADFPNAKIAEQESVEGAADAKPVYAFYAPVPGQGRMVFGAYADSSANSIFGALGVSISPSQVFDPAIVDFHDPMTYGMQWSTTTSYILDISSGDPTADDGFDSSEKIDYSSNFQADASGTLILPDELGGSFYQSLRVSEDVTYVTSMDNGDGTYQQLETDYTRNYYWFVPGYGLVAQLSSTQGTSPAPEQFTRAIAFLRMFDTNRKLDPNGSTGGCTDPAPASDFRIRVSNQTVLLTWSPADCANQYAVQYTATPADPSSWNSLGNTTNTVWQGETTRTGPARFYRVVSMK
jgi:hypothetical protein